MAAVFDEDKLGWARSAAIADSATANATATYAQGTADLINELKTKLNAALAALRDANIIAKD